MEKGDEKEKPVDEKRRGKSMEWVLDVEIMTFRT